MTYHTEAPDKLGLAGELIASLEKKWAKYYAVVAADIEPVEIEKAVRDVIRRHYRLFSVLDEIDKEPEAQVVQAF